MPKSLVRNAASAVNVMLAMPDFCQSMRPPRYCGLKPVPPAVKLCVAAKLLVHETLPDLTPVDPGLNRVRRVPLADPPDWVNIAVLPHDVPFDETWKSAGAVHVMSPVRFAPDIALLCGAEPNPVLPLPNASAAVSSVIVGAAIHWA